MLFSGLAAAVLYTFGLTWAARIPPCQSVALVVCNDIIKGDGTSNDLCPSMSTAIDHCMNQFQDFNNGGWLPNPKAVIVDAPSQHCILFE